MLAVAVAGIALMVVENELFYLDVSGKCSVFLKDVCLTSYSH